jgi:hypothetical protein
MAKDANTNEPSDEDVNAAVDNIEKNLDDLLKEKMAYMSRAKRIRDQIGVEYDHAVNHGISKKLLKSIIKERELHRKITALSADLEFDEAAERKMLLAKLGDFADTPLGQAALNSGEHTLRSVGA